MYKNEKLGWAINIKIIAGVIVHISSINVPWVQYLYTIGELEFLKTYIITPKTQNTDNKINTKK